MSILLWFRNDLRIHDHLALFTAVHRANSMRVPLIACFFDCVLQWKKQDMAPVRHDFLLRRAFAFKQELKNLGIELFILQTQDFSSCVSDLVNLCKLFKVREVFCSKEREIYEQKRDERAKKSLSALQIPVHFFNSDCILEPGTVLNAQGKPFQVFTAFFSQWRKSLDKKAERVSSVPCCVTRLLKTPEIPGRFSYAGSLEKWGALYPVQESQILQKLEDFLRDGVKEYHQKRDFPALEGTSFLSPYLAIGSLSSGYCISRLFEVLKTYELSPDTGEFVWMSEIVWREFYKHVGCFFPRIMKHRCFRSEYDSINWDGSDENFDRWRRGQTGYPIVDAGMRQLNHTGWMHNRLRMITASFLIKDLHIDWRRGERYFMQNLVDGDLFANNGGWQWAASTGTDSVPYFRIFNPVTQGERFDSQGEFVRRWVPELCEVPTQWIHCPWEYKKKYTKTLSYPDPVVDHAKARIKTLEMYKKL